MNPNFHDKPFDNETIIKLEMYKNYLQEWLPVFIKLKIKHINIFDFFAGPGYDSIGKKGSPIIAIEALPFHFPDIVTHKLTISLFFFDGKQKNCKKLLANIADLKVEKKPFQYKVERVLFPDSFEKYFEEMRKKDTANLLFIDQFGVKLVTPELFTKLISLSLSDFLFFISSATIKRFNEQESIYKILKISQEEVAKTPHEQIHTLVYEKYKLLLNKNYYLSPFSIKKKSSPNVYGLIFGSNHPLAMEKILKICWEKDNLNGEANFDIKREGKISGQGDLFTGVEDKSNKLSIFEEELELNILNGYLKSDKDVVLYALQKSFLNIHTKPVLDRLKQADKIKFSKREALKCKSVMDKEREPSIIKIL